MRINEKTAISTPKILLVPYESHHVPTYHEWMKDPEIQTLTASEPLSLPSEYTMQSTWRIDTDKLTFIACLPLPLPLTPSPTPNQIQIQPKIHDAPNLMIGDINLFLSPDDSNNSSSSNTITGEIELMIAPLQHRHKGYGRAALYAFLKYVVCHKEEIVGQYARNGEEVVLGEFRVKIGEGNLASIGLFEGVGFRRVGEVNYFGEVELRLGVGDGVGLEVEGWREVGYGEVEGNE